MPHRRLLPVALLLLMPGAALAHPGHDGAAGLAAGFHHPLAGVDHWLAMIGVGVIAGLRGGHALWSLPLVFLALMAAGAGSGAAGLTPPLVEAGITASVVVFGALALVGRTLPTAVLVGLIGSFAVFHGLAHAAERPDAVSGLAFVGGFLAATALLHAAGLGLGVAVATGFGPRVERTRTGRPNSPGQPMPGP